VSGLRRLEPYARGDGGGACGRDEYLCVGRIGRESGAEGAVESAGGPRRGGCGRRRRRRGIAGRRLAATGRSGSQPGAVPAAVGRVLGVLFASPFLLPRADGASASEPGAGDPRWPPVGLGADLLQRLAGVVPPGPATPTPRDRLHRARAAATRRPGVDSTSAVSGLPERLRADESSGNTSLQCRPPRQGISTGPSWPQPSSGHRHDQIRDGVAGQSGLMGRTRANTPLAYRASKDALNGSESSYQGRVVAIRRLIVLVTVAAMSTLGLVTLGGAAAQATTPDRNGPLHDRGCSRGLNPPISSRDRAGRGLPSPAQRDCAGWWR
jgi:hypothetical protein